MKERKQITRTHGQMFFDRLITKPEAAAMFEKCVATIYNRQKRGKTNFSEVRVANNTIRLKMSEIIDFLPISESEKAEYKKTHLANVPAIMTVIKAASVLGVSVSLVYKIIEGTAGISDKLPFIKENDKMRVKRCDLYEFIEKRTVKN